MKIDKLILGDFRTNCYILSNGDEAIVIDPGSHGENIEIFLKKNNYRVVAIFLTHGHQDHIGACDFLFNKYQCKIYAHINEKVIITASDPSKLIEIPYLKWVKVNAPVTYFEGDFNRFEVAGMTLDAILTPGHSSGSVTYVLKDYLRIFSGDTLMKNTIGRTDFPTSNPFDMQESLKIYKNFKSECKVLPGHGDSTTIGLEKSNNQFLIF